MVCKFCRFRTDDSKTTCPNCGATLTGGKVEVNEEKVEVEEIRQPEQATDELENFQNKVQGEFNKAKNNAVRFITFVVIVLVIIFIVKACGK